jgi:hypothetical protein
VTSGGGDCVHALPDPTLLAVQSHYTLQRSRHKEPNSTGRGRGDGIEWIHLAQYRGQWRAFVRMEMRLRVSYKAAIFLSGFSRKTHPMELLPRLFAVRRRAVREDVTYITARRPKYNTSLNLPRDPTDVKRSVQDCTASVRCEVLMAVSILGSDAV